MGWANKALITQAKATMTIDHCQLMANMREGTMAPAIMAPTGTPVCLIEKTRPICSGGVVRAKI